jgi:hypothetical protein
MHFVYSDNRGKTWSKRYKIDLPKRDVDVIPGRKHGWVNHPPKLMPTGEVVFTFCAGRSRVHAWQLGSPEAYVVHCENILTEQDPEKLEFKMYPDDYQGIRTHVYDHWHNPALQILLAFFNGVPEDTGWTFQEMTIIELSNGHWLAVGRCALGAVAYTISKDRGKTWTRAEPLLYKPGGDPIQHPITMCPIAKTSDGRIVLMFTNNDGTKRGARHIWDGDGRTRNPQWFVVGREIPGETRNGGLIFGEPRILAKVDDTGDVNLKTGISMPQFFERNGRYFVMYNINKEHILLDEIPESVLDDMTPNLP